MAHSVSARKRIRQNAKNNARNRWRQRRVKASVKSFETVVHSGDATKAQEAYVAVTRTLDKIAATGTIHKNAAARKKSRLAKRLNAMKSSGAPAA